MHHARHAALFALCLAPFPVLPASAQDLDCANALAQQEMNLCAEQDWQRADADLNEAYKAALQVLTDIDKDMPAELQGGPKALKEAQRAWITFRDKACEVEGYPMRGGSAEPLLVYGCLRKLTEDRAAQLWTLTSDLGGS